MLRCFLQYNLFEQFLVGCLVRISWPLLRKHHWYIIMRFMAPKLEICMWNWRQDNVGNLSCEMRNFCGCVWYCGTVVYPPVTDRPVIFPLSTEKFYIRFDGIFFCKMFFVKYPAKYLWWWHYWVLSAIMTGAVTLRRLPASLAAVWDWISSQQQVWTFLI